MTHGCASTDWSPVTSATANTALAAVLSATAAAAKGNGNTKVKSISVSLNDTGYADVAEIGCGFVRVRGFLQQVFEGSSNSAGGGVLLVYHA